MPHPRSIQRTYLVLLLGSTLAGRGQAVTGAAMLTGSVAGGFIAEQTTSASRSCYAGSSSR